MQARPALVAVVAVLVLLLQMPQAGPLGSWAVQLYNQDPRTFVLGWRGVLALHVVAIDTWFLAGFGVTNLPFAFRMHWATEPVWIFVSFSCISIGTPELLHVFQWWLGPTISRPEIAVSVALYATAAFGALTTVHLITMAFAPNNQRRRGGPRYPYPDLPRPTPPTLPTLTFPSLP